MTGSMELATTHTTMDSSTLSAVSVSKADMTGKKQEHVAMDLSECWWQLMFMQNSDAG